MDMSFSISVNSSKSENELLELILTNVEAAVRDGGYIQINSNVLKFEENCNYQPKLCEDKELGWDYYRYHCDVFPVMETNIMRQQKLAEQLLQVFSDDGAKVFFIAEFEVSDQ